MARLRSATLKNRNTRSTTAFAWAHVDWLMALFSVQGLCQFIVNRMNFFACFFSTRLGRQLIVEISDLTKLLFIQVFNPDHTIAGRFTRRQ
ncbi:MAG: hypothetical protein AUI84_13660 [Delftia sp. 13_1_40CM_3_66_6]|nr:MAG: hypothetical protein AUI84_13660 [Delftia sp. 13_1_40CM_3_66_6]